jgi:hypothetical protein
MDEERKKILLGMSEEERTARFDELRQKLGTAQPVSIAGGGTPLEASLDEHEEYLLLKKLLGYG